MLTNVNCAMGLRYHMAAFSLMICICMINFNISAGEDSAASASGPKNTPVGQVGPPAVVAGDASGGKKAGETPQSAPIPQQATAQQPAGPAGAAAPTGQPAAAPAGQPAAAQSEAGTNQPDKAAAPGKDNAPKTPVSGVSQTIDDVESSGHFMGYFIATAVACVALYLMYHNRHKMLAFIVEGRRSATGRRRVVTTSGSAEYRQLSNAEEGTPSDIGGGGASSRSEPPKGYVY